MRLDSLPAGVIGVVKSYLICIMCSIHDPFMNCEFRRILKNTPGEDAT